MKYLLLLFFTTLPFLSSYADTTYVVRDSIYADSVYGEVSVAFAAAALDTPNGAYASFSGIATLDLAFRVYGGTKLRTIQKNAEIWIWGKKDENVDTSAAKVVFFKTDASGALVDESEPYYIDSGLNKITVDKDYTYIEFTLTGNEVNPGSKGYLLDAVLLLQNRDSVVKTGSVAGEQFAKSGIIANYPNPFIASQPTMLSLHVESAGDVSLYIFDISGREVDHVPLGVLMPGDYSIPVTVAQPQVYLARLFVDGIPTGSAYRMTAR